MEVFVLVAIIVQWAHQAHLKIHVQMEPTVTHLALRERNSVFHVILEVHAQEMV